MTALPVDGAGFGTGSGTGCGVDEIPDEWQAELELKGLIEETAMDLLDRALVNRGRS